MLFLAGDVGGTKTRLGIFRTGRAQPEALAEAVFPSDPESSLDVIVQAFLQKERYAVTAACFGVAGPVMAGTADITNLPWRLAEKTLSDALSIPRVKLLNDLEATAWAIPFLNATDRVVLHEGQPAAGGSIAVIAPGTGLGEAYLTWDGSHYQAYASEGGHTDFAPKNALQRDLLQAFSERYEHVSYERVCSGHAIPDVYEFLKNRGNADEPEWLHEKLRTADDPTPVIISTALDAEKTSDLSRMTLGLFMEMLGSEAGNLALKILATGGVYLAGGLAFNTLPVLKNGRFMQAFLKKGRMSPLVARMPVYVIVNPRVALIGAACWGLKYHKEQQEE